MICLGANLIEKEEHFMVKHKPEILTVPGSFFGQTRPSAFPILPKAQYFPVQPLTPAIFR